jgi:thioredoxin
MEKLTLETFKEKIFKMETDEWKFEGTKPAIIDFYADWCGPCKMVGPILEKLSEDYNNKIDIYKVDVDTQYELSSFFGIRSIPSILFIPMEGQPEMAVGSFPKNKIESMIQSKLLREAVA